MPFVIVNMYEKYLVWCLNNPFGLSYSTVTVILQSSFGILPLSPYQVNRAPALDAVQCDFLPLALYDATVSHEVVFQAVVIWRDATVAVWAVEGAFSIGFGEADGEGFGSLSFHANHA